MNIKTHFSYLVYIIYRSNILCTLYANNSLFDISDREIVKLSYCMPMYNHIYNNTLEKYYICESFKLKWAIMLIEMPNIMVPSITIAMLNDDSWIIQHQLSYFLNHC